MALDFEIGHGDTLPSVTATALGSFDGSETVVFRVRRPGATAWTVLSGEFADAAAGDVAHHWVSGETDTPGYYLAEFVITSTTDVTTVSLVGLIRGLSYSAGVLGVASVEDVATKKGRDLDVHEVRFLEAQLPMIQTLLESRLNRSLATLTVTGERHVVDWSSPTWNWRRFDRRGEFLPLDRTPVFAVSSVQVDGIALATYSWRAERSGVTIFDMLTPSSIVPPSVVLVDYQGGYNIAHPVVRLARDVVTHLAIRRLDKFVEDDAASVTSLSVNGYHAVYESMDFTDDDLKAVRRYRSRVVT